MNQNRLFIHLQTLPLGMHYKWKEIIDSECKTTNRISWGQITDKRSHWVEGQLYCESHSRDWRFSTHIWLWRTRPWKTSHDDNNKKGLEHTRTCVWTKPCNIFMKSRCLSSSNRSSSDLLCSCTCQNMSIFTWLQTYCCKMHTYSSNFIIMIEHPHSHPAREQ